MKVKMISIITYSSLFLFCLLFVYSLQAQNLDNLLKRSHVFLRETDDSCRIICNHIRKKSLESKKFRLFGEATIVLSQFYLYTGKEDSTEIILSSSLTRYAKELPPLKVMIINDRLANVYISKGNYSKALKFAISADSIVDKSSATCSCRPKITLASIHDVLGNIELASKFALEARACAQELNNRFGKIASLYSYLHINREDLSNPRHSAYINEYAGLITKIKNNQVYIHGELLAFDDTNIDKEEVLKVCYEKERATKDGPVPVVFHYLETLISLTKYKSALSIIEEEKKLYKKSDDITTFLVMVNMEVAAYEGLNDFKNAFYSLQELTHLNDSIKNETIKSETIDLQLKYESTKKANEILEKTIALSKKEKTNKFLIASLLFLGLLAVSIYMLIKQRHKANLKLINNQLALEEEKVKNHERKEKLLALEYTIMGQEEERKRIAQDLHDGLGGLLTTVKAHMNTIAHGIKLIDQLDVLSKTNELVDTACNEVRRISRNMMPSSLNMHGLSSALKEIVFQLQNVHALNVTSNIDDISENLNETQEMFIFRIFQELTNNIVKYAQPEHVIIQVNNFENEINILVEDDGIGMNLTQALNKKGMGLKSIQSRVKYLNGSIDIDTALNSGTSVTINIPNA